MKLYNKWVLSCKLLFYFSNRTVLSAVLSAFEVSLEMSKEKQSEKGHKAS